MNTLEKVRKPPHAKTMGIEIECLMPNDWRGSYKHHGFFYAGSDGSIRTNYETIGTEFVSQPMPYSFLVKELARLAKRVPVWTVNNTCGIHVHVSKKWASEKRMEALYKALRDMKVAEILQLFGRVPNDYCRINNYWGYSRYNAINCSPEHTYEFRMFSSGNVGWSQECLRRVKLMVEHRGKYSYEKLLDLFTQPDQTNDRPLPLKELNHVQLPISPHLPMPEAAPRTTVYRVRRQGAFDYETA